MSDTKDLQKLLFKEIEGRIKLEDESLKFKIKDMNIGQKLLKREIILNILEKNLEKIKLKHIGMAM